MQASHGRLDVEDLIDMPLAERQALLADLGHVAGVNLLEVM